MPEAHTPAGLTTREVARLLRVGTSKVIAWIKAGELVAINTATSLSGRPRYVVLPDAIAEFQKRRTAGPTPKPARRKKRTAMVDYYP